MVAGVDVAVKPRLLDLFCGAGGAAMGYHRAGFEVVGVDVEPHPEFPFTFVRADAIEVLRNALDLDEFDAIHASPPCQAYTAMSAMPNAGSHPDLVDVVRDLLVATGLPYVIENVPGSPVEAHQPSLFGGPSGGLLCGSMFNLRTSHFELRRHRLFESSVSLSWPACRHRRDLTVVGFYGDHARVRQRVDGHKDRGVDILGAQKMQLVADLMDIDWMNWDDARQAIPPAYTEFIGRQLLAHLGAAPPTGALGWEDVRMPAWWNA
jgi:DNA (cytosine-5)-methyltransferase 1